MTGPDEEFKKRLLATFREEAEEYLSVITEGLITLEKAGSSGRPEITEHVYRKIHSLKGAARAVNIREIELVCQNMENVFSAIQKGRIQPDADAFDIFHHAVQVTRASLSGKKNTALSPADIVLALRALISPKMEMEGETKAYTAGAGLILPAPAPSDRARKSRAPSDAALKSGDHEEAGNGEPSGVGTVLPATYRQAGSKFIPSIQTGNGETVRIVSHKLDRLIARSDDLLATRLFITHRMRELEGMMTRFSLWQWNQALMSSDLHLLRETLSGTKKSEIPDDLILPLKHMLEFIEYDREFITYLRHDLATHIRETERDRAALEASASEISDLIHDAVLLPVTSILVQFSGFVREYSRSLGKKVDFVVEGEGIEMDRRILEALKDPLMHLINNSIDHGIEYPDMRENLKKPLTGVIRIRVVPLSGSRVGIEVTDDGAGINGSEIRKTAVRNGLITEKEGNLLSDEEAQWLVFKSGLSTKPIVTDISGRGLGLAIVEDTVTRLGGDLFLFSAPGRGTSITLRLPVRLATMRGVVVRSGRHMYVLPMQQVRQVVRIRPDSIITHDNLMAVSIKGEFIRLIRLTNALGITDHRTINDETAQIPIIILAYGAGQIACMVDEIIRVQEIVVRSLGSQLKSVPRITGAVILGDGTVSLVLDPIELIQRAQRPDRWDAMSMTSEETPFKILVVEDSVTTRTLLLTILERAGYQVETAVDGMEAFAMLKDNEFDMVISDVDMPRMNGFLLTEKIRADTRLSKMPVVLITSLGSPEDQHHGAAVGADAYLIKSNFTPVHFLSVVGNLMKGIRRPA
ncbi:MAG: chemotaxis protein CheA [Methanoregula sp. PtaU1.Bin051]|nr:MAG: chemotaxis protein CheA [Methanoregula sp. PtaU1.Bin051]